MEARGNQEHGQQRKQEGGRRLRWVGGLGALLGVVIGGVATSLVWSEIAVNQGLIDTASVENDTVQFRTGSASLVWSFDLQPNKHWAWSPTRTVDAFLHLEVRGTPSGRISGLDWRKYYAVRFFAEASTDGLGVSEINLFAGSKFTQYMFHGNSRFTTAWQEFTVPLRAFVLAPWEGRAARIGAPALGNVTAFGLDENTSSGRNVGRIWLDDVRLVDASGRETLLSDCAQRRFKFEGQRLFWIADARILG